VAASRRPDKKLAAFSHTLRKMQETSEWPVVDSTLANRILETATPPTPQEQADGFIRWFGKLLLDEYAPGAILSVSDEEVAAIIGAVSESGVGFIVQGLIHEGLLQGNITTSGSTITLTFSGWQRYDELKRGTPSGRKAFMAMQYNDRELDRIVNEYFRPAVAQTGFALHRLDDEPKAGLIDDRLRVEIQSARFLIVDLTRANRGAYWEAGYAEGLGKPVIFTCEESCFKEDSHFDTNHHLHVLWHPERLGEAMRRLKDTIRATIPEAKREDD
jgi:hypothetical protein